MRGKALIIAENFAFHFQIHRATVFFTPFSKKLYCYETSPIIRCLCVLIKLNM